MSAPRPTKGKGSFLLALFIFSFAVSLGLGYLTLRSKHLHARFSVDMAVLGSHKIHGTSVPRIGGISIFCGWFASLVASSYVNKLPAETTVIWVMCLLPVFFAGLAEDLTKRVRPSVRLFFSFLTAAFAFMFLDASVNRVDVPQLDYVLGIPAVSFVFTLIAIGGVAHAINIIDGLNGLASGVCLIALLALGYVAFNVNDTHIVLMCGLGVAAILGFRVWNYPSGQLFCGDGGAYFIGAYVAILSTLLIKRHAEVSAWFPLLLVLYPVWETLFSAYRRRVLRGLPASTADKLHMHTLFYKRVKHPLDGQMGGRYTRRNSDASISMMMFAAGSALPAVLWWGNGAYLLAALFAYITVYLAIYRRLVRFRSRAKRAAKKRAGSYIIGRVAALMRGASRKAIRPDGKTP
jgi:UDP-N-acetylmuramyl pentapeptide phosphotransferase/UDP-N-acetylglucosamine-1-phosphate transferase